MHNVTLRFIIPAILCVFLPYEVRAQSDTTSVDEVARNKADEAQISANDTASRLNSIIARLEALENKVDNDTLSSLACTVGSIPRFDGSSWQCGTPPYTDVAAFGTVGDGVTDDTAAIQAAIDATAFGGLLFFPQGSYLISDEFVIDKRISIAGIGSGSQIFQATDGKSIFVFQKACSICATPSGIYMRDLHLGSAATAPGSSLIKLVNASNNLFENITMIGGYYGVHLQGSLINTFTGLRSGVNIGGFFAAGSLSNNQFWVFAEPLNNISSNANTFVSSSLEGGTNGIYIKGGQGQSDNFFYGGTIEGMTGVCLYFERTAQPSIVSGIHFEGCQQHDIVIDQSGRIRIESIIALTEIELKGTTADVVIANSTVEFLTLGPDVVRTRVESVNLNPSGTPRNPVDDQATDTHYVNVSGFNITDRFSTIGVGVKNPDSNPFGATPDLKIQVNGRIKATAFDTGDITFRKDGKVLWRMFEEEDGLYLENMTTRKTSRVFMETDVQTLLERLKFQGEAIAAIEKDLKNIRHQLRSQR